LSASVPLPESLAGHRPPAVSVTVTDSLGPKSSAEWTRLVGGGKHSPSDGDVAQLPAWARLRGTVGFTARYVLVHSGPDLVAGAQLLERRLPLLGRVGYLPYGPVVADGFSSRTSVTAALADALTDLARTRLRMLFVQPPPGGEAISAALLDSGFRRSTADVAPGRSLRLDLRQDSAELRAGLSKRLRTWTNRWSSRGVSVRIGTEADLDLLATLVADTGEHQGFAPVSASYLRTLVHELGRDAVLFVGELDGTPVASALFTRCGGTLKLRFAGMNRSDKVDHASVPAAVQWHAIGWAKQAGLRWFDFGGISAEAAELLALGAGRGELRGVDRFKASFGGQLHHCPPAVELISSPLLRTGYDLSRRWPAGRRAIELAKSALRTGRNR
jgi:lipid II:glycine glycyltransferase (peptidoglycan interpeptide bridge formation enzyme)